MPTNKWQWMGIGIATIAFFALLGRANGAVDRAAEDARQVRDSIRLVVIADSTLRVRDREDFEVALLASLRLATEAQEERETARSEARTARAERDGLASRVAALPDEVIVIPRVTFDSVVVASVEIERALMEVNRTLVVDTVRLSDLLSEARLGWTGEIESHDLTREENAANRSLAEAFERAANPGFFSKLWEGKEEFVIGIVVGAVAISAFGN